jgi:hypothetical protein
MEPFVAALAVDVTRRSAGSALPGAPIRPPRDHRRRALRRRAAALLHRLADRLDARPAPIAAARPGCGA